MKRSLLLVFTIFYVVNLNAMHSFKRLVPLLLRQGNKQVARMSHLTPACYPMMRFSSQANNESCKRSLNFERNLNKMIRDVVEIGGKIESEKKDSCMYLKVNAMGELLDDEKVKEYLESERFKQVLLDALDKYFQGKKFQVLVNDYAKEILKNKKAMNELLENEGFIKLINSEEIQQYFRTKNPEAFDGFLLGVMGSLTCILLYNCLII